MIRALARWMAVAALVVALPAAADGPPDVLGGALERMARTGVVRLGYRADAAPFAWETKAGAPAGYSLDICVAVAGAIREATGGRPLRIAFVRVDARDRIDRVARGDVDLECGSTTVTPERSARVAFSPPIFVTGTRVAVPSRSRARSLGQLPQGRIAVVAGTTNETVLREVVVKRALDVSPVPVKSLAEAFDLVALGRADAVVGDDILLVGELARSGRRPAFKVVGDPLSFDRYAIAFARNDEALAAVVDGAMRQLAESGELAGLYHRWFVRTLPGGIRLGLPMSAELRRAFELLGQPPG